MRKNATLPVGLCHCGKPLLSTVAVPRPGIHYCILGMCPPGMASA